MNTSGKRVEKHIKQSLSCYPVLEKVKRDLMHAYPILEDKYFGKGDS